MMMLMYTHSFTVLELRDTDRPTERSHLASLCKLKMMNRIWTCTNQRPRANGSLNVVRLRRICATNDWIKCENEHPLSTAINLNYDDDDDDAHVPVVVHSCYGEPMRLLVNSLISCFERRKEKKRWKNTKSIDRPEESVAAATNTCQFAFKRDKLTVIVLESAIFSLTRFKFKVIHITFWIGMRTFVDNWPMLPRTLYREHTSREYLAELARRNFVRTSYPHRFWLPICKSLFHSNYNNEKNSQTYTSHATRTSNSLTQFIHCFIALPRFFSLLLSLSLNFAPVLSHSLFLFLYLRPTD